MTRRKKGNTWIGLPGKQVVKLKEQAKKVGMTGNGPMRGYQVAEDWESRQGERKADDDGQAVVFVDIVRWGDLFRESWKTLCDFTIIS